MILSQVFLIYSLFIFPVAHEHESVTLTYYPLSIQIQVLDPLSPRPHSASLHYRKPNVPRPLLVSNQNQQPILAHNDYHNKNKQQPSLSSEQAIINNNLMFDSYLRQPVHETKPGQFQEEYQPEENDIIRVKRNKPSYAHGAQFQLKVVGRETMEQKCLIAPSFKNLLKKADIYSESLKIKQITNNIIDENTRLKTKLAMLEKEHGKLFKAVSEASNGNNNLTGPRQRLTVNNNYFRNDPEYSRQSNYKDISQQPTIFSSSTVSRETTARIPALGKMLEEVLAEKKFHKQQNEKIKHSAKYNKILEFEVEKRYLEDEYDRLATLYKNMEQDRIQEDQNIIYIQNLKADYDRNVDESEHLYSKNKVHQEALDFLKQEYNIHRTQIQQREKALTSELISLRTKLTEILNQQQPILNEISNYRSAAGKSFKKIVLINKVKPSSSFSLSYKDQPRSDPQAQQLRKQLENLKNTNQDLRRQFLEGGGVLEQINNIEGSQGMNNLQNKKVAQRPKNVRPHTAHVKQQPINTAQHQVLNPLDLDRIEYVNPKKDRQNLNKGPVQNSRSFDRIPDSSRQQPAQKVEVPSQTYKVQAKSNQVPVIKIYQDEKRKPVVHQRYQQTENDPAKKTIPGVNKPDQKQKIEQIRRLEPEPFIDRPEAISQIIAETNNKTIEQQHVRKPESQNSSPVSNSLEKKGKRDKHKQLEDLRQLITYRMKAHNFGFGDFKQQIMSKDKESYSTEDITQILFKEPFNLQQIQIEIVLSHFLSQEETRREMSLGKFLQKMKSIVNDFFLISDLQYEAMFNYLTAFINKNADNLYKKYQALRNPDSTITRANFQQLMRSHFGLADNHIDFLICELSLTSFDMSHLNFESLFSIFQPELAPAQKVLNKFSNDVLDTENIIPEESSRGSESGSYSYAHGRSRERLQVTGGGRTHTGTHSMHEEPGSLDQIVEQSVNEPKTRNSSSLIRSSDIQHKDDTGIIQQMKTSKKIDPTKAQQDEENYQEEAFEETEYKEDFEQSDKKQEVPVQRSSQAENQAKTQEHKLQSVGKTPENQKLQESTPLKSQIDDEVPEYVPTTTRQKPAGGNTGRYSTPGRSSVEESYSEYMHQSFSMMGDNINTKQGPDSSRAMEYDVISDEDLAI